MPLITLVVCGLLVTSEQSYLTDEGTKAKIAAASAPEGDKLTPWQFRIHRGSNIN